MKFNRKAQATWKGTGMEGTGTISTQSLALDEAPYSFHTRFEDNQGTNPEELIGAAHAGCFTMQLSFLISKAGFEPGHLETDVRVFYDDGEIPVIKLGVTGEVPEMSEEKFVELAQKAKEICPISRLLKARIELKAEMKRNTTFA